MGVISYKELLNGHTIVDLTIAQQQNLQDLQKRVQVIRDAWGKPMIVTSGFRTVQDQARINPKVKSSAHMEGKAVDFKDDGSLYNFLKEDYEKKGNDSLLVVNGLYMEKGTDGWVHLQSRPTLNRIFIP